MKTKVKTTRRFIPTNCNSLDKLLGGGLPTGCVSLIYGEAETGKTSLSIQCAVNAVRGDYKVIFVDSDGTFSPRRLSQIAYHDYEEVSPEIVLVKPTTLQEQAFVIEHLDEYITRRVGLLVVDTVTSLYRTELGRPNETFTLNRDLNRQVACLAQISKTYKIATLLTSQVRSFLGQEGASIEPVATRVLKFWSDIVLELKHTDKTGVIKAVVKKHLKRKCLASCYISIEKTGIRDYTDN